MTEPDVLKILVENSMSFGVDCKMEDTCTGLEGQTACHLPPGDAKENLVGYIIATDVTEDPADNWGSCASALVCLLCTQSPFQLSWLKSLKKRFQRGRTA